MTTKSLNIVLGVGGGIAAYKVAALLRTLTEAGHDVRVVPTPSALKFVGTATWEALSGNPVTAEVWDNVSEVPHVTIGKNADLIIVAPATADLLSRAAHGAANDLLTNVLLTATCPVVYAPAMHTEMWLNAATQSNVDILRSRGAVVLEPANGRLTGDDSGPGRMPEPEHIAAAALALASTTQRDLNGRRVLVTAGGTRENLDPVRFIGNRSSGKQGVAIAQAARDRGADVTLVCANVTAPVPSGVTVLHVETGQELKAAVEAHIAQVDVIVMAAAVADFAPAHVSDVKIKKSDDGLAPTIELVRTPDILTGIVANKLAHQFVVGFAAETGDSQASVVEHGRAKLARKGCDALVVNDVTGDKAFGSDKNEVTILLKGDAHEVHVPRASKVEIANALWDLVAPALK
ncbi:MAG: bifunctional phosphopantothenoylcysteine decarboxylase/phosphopantothenate--cysteine ligase CoaBC [Actinomycetes bacterium]